MYSLKKENLMHISHLSIVGIACLISILTVFYPRSSEHDPKVYKQMKDEYEKYYEELPPLVWNQNVKAVGKAVGIKREESSQDPGSVMTSGFERIRVVVVGYKDGFVKGDFVRYSVEKIRNKPIVRILETVPFKMADNRMPPPVKGELRKFRVGTSVYFKVAYAAMWLVLVLVYFFYRQLSAVWRQTYSFDRPPETGLTEFRRYLAMKVELLKNRHVHSDCDADVSGDGRCRFGLYWHQKAFAAVVILMVVFAVWWRHFTSPPFSFEEMKALMDEAGRIRYEYVMS